ncbi:MAG: hypothetical protein ACI92W_000404 [Paraglaciecola sp.]|jgi:hypothetical protein
MEELKDNQYTLFKVFIILLGQKLSYMHLMSNFTIRCFMLIAMQVTFADSSR